MRGGVHIRVEKSTRAGAAVTRDYFNAIDRQEYGRASPYVFAGQF